MNKAKEFFNTVLGDYIELMALDETEKNAIFKFAEQYTAEVSREKDLEIERLEQVLKEISGI